MNWYLSVKQASDKWQGDWQKTMINAFSAVFGPATKQINNNSDIKMYKYEYSQNKQMLFWKLTSNSKIYSICVGSYKAAYPPIPPEMCMYQIDRDNPDPSMVFSKKNLAYGQASSPADILSEIKKSIDNDNGELPPTQYEIIYSPQS